MWAAAKKPAGSKRGLSIVVSSLTIQNVPPTEARVDQRLRDLAKGRTRNVRELGILHEIDVIQHVETPQDGAGAALFSLKRTFFSNAMLTLK